MTTPLDPKDVEAFLRDNPSFLQDRPGLLAVLNLPHGGEGAVSLVERQVTLLRERNIQSRQKLTELSAIGRENDRLLEATRNAILALLSAEDRADLVRIWGQQVTGSFAAQMGNLIWLDSDSSESASESASESVTKKLIGQGDSFSGPLRPEEMNALFGTDAAEGSAALSTIRDDQNLMGVIAVGSSDLQRYRAGDGTLFLDYLAEVIGQLPACK